MQRKIIKEKYLPSKKFIYSIGILAVIGFLFFLFSNLTSKKSHFSNSSEKNQLQTDNLTINDLLQKDTVGDGIPDWEKSLWGIDPNSPTVNGIPDAVYIANKKKELNMNQADDNTNLTETDKFAREFFATFTAMKQSGTDTSTIDNFSSSLGQKIADPTIIDQYSTSDIKIDNNNSLDEQKKYYDKIKKLFNKYRSAGIGDELSVIGDQLTSSAGQSSDDKNKKLLTIAKAYEDFANEMMQVPVPGDLTQIHLKIANDSNNTGVSVGNMAKISNDPVIGLSGLSEYQKYSDELVTTVGDLETTLSIQSNN